MVDLTTSYMGLSLKSPIIAASSGLTRSLSNLQSIEKNGAGAVVLKSLFEEQIKFEIRKVFAHDEMQSAYTEAEDYIQNYARAHALDEYLTLIRDAKKHLAIPVIPSINCVSSHEWPSFAKEIELAGADALELNVFVLPFDTDKVAEDYEALYFEVLEKVREQVKIPVALKISGHFSGLANMVKRFAWAGAKGVVMFNRFFAHDFDIQKQKMIPASAFSTPDEITQSLRWVGILAGRVPIDLCASTGVHDHTGVVKQLLAGAKAVQVCSALYKNGLGHIATMKEGVSHWMKENKYAKISDFSGAMSFRKGDNPAAYNRVQFMKHFAEIE